MSYVALIYVQATLSWHPVVQPGYPDGDARLMEFGTVLEAEQAINDPHKVAADVRVFDLSKFETAVPLVEPGAQVLVNGSWVEAK